MKCLTLVLLLMTVVCLPGYADHPFSMIREGKIYPGSMAVRLDPSDPIPYYHYGTVENPSTTNWLDLILPAVNDHLAVRIRKGLVRVIDGHPFRDIQCALNSRFRYGGYYAGWWGRYETNKREDDPEWVPAGWHQQDIWFGRMGSSDAAHYYFHCRLPPIDVFTGIRSAVITYYLEESNE